MEDNGLASQAVALLVSYLVKASEAVAAGVGRDVWGQFRGAMSKLYTHLKKKFNTDSQAANDLALLKQEPHSQGLQTVVRESLSRFIEQDQQFAQELRNLVKSARHAGGDTITQVVNVSGGTAGDITQIGKVERGD